LVLEVETSLPKLCLPFIKLFALWVLNGKYQRFASQVDVVVIRAAAVDLDHRVDREVDGQTRRVMWTRTIVGHKD
jgi:hypothetical protein